MPAAPRTCSPPTSPPQQIAAAVDYAVTTAGLHLAVNNAGVSGFGGLVFGLSGIGAPQGMSVLPPWVVAIAGAAALVLFVLRQPRLQRADQALLDLHVFRSALLSTSTARLAVAMMALFGALLILFLHYQDVLHLTPAESGLLLLPGGIAIGLFAPVAGRLSDRLGPGTVLPIGSSTVAGPSGCCSRRAARPPRSGSRARTCS
ncbi:MFS transporter [Polymorphospora sp. NPDC050346]|uniref:MFS transporter n=1 Tax=Polymorphospora sp. NPDC050346 TaxID=3155780 RepID=UPI003409B63E